MKKKPLNNGKLGPRGPFFIGYVADMVQSAWGEGFGM